MPILDCGASNTNTSSIVQCLCDKEELEALERALASEFSGKCTITKSQTVDSPLSFASMIRDVYIIICFISLKSKRRAVVLLSFDNKSGESRLLA
jgi:hypothetical protein